MAYSTKHICMCACDVCVKRPNNLQYNSLSFTFNCSAIAHFHPHLDKIHYSTAIPEFIPVNYFILTFPIQGTFQSSLEKELLAHSKRKFQPNKKYFKGGVGVYSTSLSIFSIVNQIYHKKNKEQLFLCISIHAPLSKLLVLTDQFLPYWKEA